MPTFCRLSNPKFFDFSFGNLGWLPWLCMVFCVDDFGWPILPQNPPKFLTHFDPHPLDPSEVHLSIYRSSISHGENGGTLNNQPHIHLFVNGYLLGITPSKGLVGGLKQLGYQHFPCESVSSVSSVSFLKGFLRSTDTTLNDFLLTYVNSLFFSFPPPKGKGGSKPPGDKMDRDWWYPYGPSKKIKSI